MTKLPDSPPGPVRRVLASPPARVLLLGFLLLLMMGLNGDVMTSYAGEPIKSVLHIIALAIAGFAVYLGHAHFIERRSVSELSVLGMGRELGIGLLIGAGLYTACELVLMARGIYRITGLNPLSYLVPAIAMAISSSVFEEMLFRGVLFRSVETWFGSWAALVVSSLVFGLTHLINPQGTLEGALFIAVEAGTLLAAAFMLTRRLFYTAVTRGKERVVIVASENAIRATIAETRRSHRHTLLADRLRACAARAASDPPPPSDEAGNNERTISEEGSDT